MPVDDRGAPPSLPLIEPPFAYERLPIWGERPLLGETMRRLCRAKADGALPELTAQWTMLPPVGPAEARLLKAMAGSSAIETRPGEWVMYEHAGPLPLIVVVGLPAEAPLPGVATNDEAEDDNSLVNPQSPMPPRVICWAVGLAGGDKEPGRFSGPLPPAPELWSVFLCSREAFNSSTMGITMLPDLPSDIRRTMTLPLQGNGCLVAFQGTGSAKHWMHRFDEWYQEREGARMWPWEDASGAWHARYSEPAMQVDVNLTVDSEEQMAGTAAIVMRRHGL